MPDDNDKLKKAAKARLTQRGGQKVVSYTPKSFRKKPKYNTSTVTSGSGAGATTQQGTLRHAMPFFGSGSKGYKRQHD